MSEQENMAVAHRSFDEVKTKAGTFKLNQEVAP
jgi:hypothetical protein